MNLKLYAQSRTDPDEFEEEIGLPALIKKAEAIAHRMALDEA